MNDETQATIRRALASEAPADIRAAAEQLEGEGLFSEAEEWRKWDLHLRPGNSEARAALDYCQQTGMVLESGRKELQASEEDLLADPDRFAGPALRLRSKLLEVALELKDGPSTRLATQLLRHAVEQIYWGDAQPRKPLRTRGEIPPSAWTEAAAKADSRGQLLEALRLWQVACAGNRDPNATARMYRCWARLEATEALELVGCWPGRLSAEERVAAQERLRKALSQGEREDLHGAIDLSLGALLAS